MELIIDVINYILSAMFIAVSISWIIFIKSMVKSFRDSPYLDKFEKITHANPKVSVILPARNEEKFITNCLTSIQNQDYENYEIIAIDDSSEDSTAKIIKKIFRKRS